MRKILLAIALLSWPALAARPIIFDTDMGNDIDDALALAMLHTLTSRGECELIGVTLTNANPSAVPFIRSINRFYGRADLPVGRAVRALDGGAQDHYMKQTMAAREKEKQNADPAPDVLRSLLRSAKEKVIIVQTGFSTNLAALLESKDGEALIRDKVALVVAMAGNFADSQPEYNVRIDVPSAKEVFEKWPTPIVLSGYEIGINLLYPAASIEHDYGYIQGHPIAVAYRAYAEMPYNRPTWDLTAALEAVRPDRDYFKLSEKGSIFVDPDGKTRFVPGEGDRRFLRLDAGKRDLIIETLTQLASQAPDRH